MPIPINERLRLLHAHYTSQINAAPNTEAKRYQDLPEEIKIRLEKAYQAWRAKGDGG